MKINTYKKYQIYNSLFLSLYYQDSNTVGHLLPLLAKFAKSKILKAQNPIEIIDDFFQTYDELIGTDRIGFLFKVIQYVERQIVLFDSIEDIIPPDQLEDQEVVQIKDLFARDNNPETRQALLDKLNDFSVRVVLTAHPTQFYRPSVLKIISNLREQISSSNIEQIDLLLHQLGLTTLVNSKNPTPLDEALNIIHICRYYYYDAIGEYYYSLTKQFPGFDNPDIISLGFWPCGDRDGNPYVTHSTTREVIDALRMTLMKCYYNDVKLLSSKLTFKEAEALINPQRQKLYQAMFTADVVVDHQELLACLEGVREVVIDKYEGLYLTEIEKLIVKVKVFKNHFAALDIRQDHSIHYQTITYILKQNGLIEDSLDEMGDDELIALLTTGSVAIPDGQGAEPLVLDTIKNIAQLNSLQQANGVQGCHRYIISNSEDIFSILFVFGLFRWINGTDDFDFDIVPLFETMGGMEKCEAVMDSLFQIPAYRSHVLKRKDKQTIMLGFSDGTKDGGYLKANWSIFRSKEILSTICDKHEVKAIFFDGRGGPPARGGGKTHNFYAALGPNIANNEIQLTIQGQTITSTYGTAEKFKFNSEQMVTSGLLSFLNQEKSAISTGNRELIEELSERSYQKYQALKEHPKFLPYLEKMTTLKYYSKARIGSRPSKRNTNRQLTLSDLRAISYVGSWSQLKQNIPGYFGIGTAIAELKAKGEMDNMQELYQTVPFFKTLIDNCMMALTKCFFELTSYMKSSDEFRDFWIFLYEEYKLSKEMTLELTQQDTLMELEQTSKQSIKTREDIVFPLIIIQNYALQMILNNVDPANTLLYEKLITRSLYGNINASRNSA